jgi:hypothetical protein
MRQRFAMLALVGLAATASVVSAQPKKPLLVPATAQDLQKPAHYQLDRTPLRQAIEQIANQARVGFYLDERALREIHVDADAPVTGRAKRETLDAALSRLLQPLHLAVLVRDEVLWITTADAAQKYLETRVYKVLVPVDDWDALLERIRQETAPKSWSQSHGPGEIVAWPAGALVVWQTPENHRALVERYGRFLAPLQTAETVGKRGRRARGGPLDFLAQPTACDFTKTPLKEALEYFAARHKAKIELDQKALDDAGIAAASPCTLRVNAVKLESALDLLLAPLGLVWAPKQGTVLITTPGEVPNKCLGELSYDIGDLLPVVDKEASTLTDLIKSTLNPPSWDSADGPGSLQLQTQTTILVKQTYPMHRALERLLTELRMVGRR